MLVLASYFTRVTMDVEMIINSFGFRNLILLTYPELIGSKNLTHEILFASCLHFLPR